MAAKVRINVKRVWKIVKKRKNILFSAAVWLLIASLVFVFPPTKITQARLINFLSNRQPPAWVKLPKGAKVDINTTKRYKGQKLAEFDQKMAVVRNDLLDIIGIKPAAAANSKDKNAHGWDKLKIDLATAGTTLSDFWGVSVLSYQGQTIIVGQGSTPINMQDEVLRWQKQIEASAAKYHVEPALVAAVVEEESGGDPNAISPTGAIGLMQLMPGTAQGLGVNPEDPAQNIDGGTHYLSIQLQRFGSLQGALAAYNAGPANVVDQHWVMMPETMEYVTRVPQLYQKYERIWQQHDHAVSNSQTGKH